MRKFEMPISAGWVHLRFRSVQGRLVLCAPLPLPVISHGNREPQAGSERLKIRRHRDLGEGHGNPLQCSCLENPRDGGAWWAAIYGVAQSQARLKRLSSSSSSRAVACQAPLSIEFPWQEY